MIESEKTYRVLYADTDAMGVVYYANYLRIYEAGRGEMMREIDMPAERFKDAGVVMPAIMVHMNYLKPAVYDDLLMIKTRMTKMPVVRIHFDQRIYNQKGEALNEAKIELAFTNIETMRPMRIPKEFKTFFEKYF